MTLKPLESQPDSYGTISDLVSVVIPTRDRPHLVRRAVRSALRQTYPRLEVIVVIDGMDNATLSALASIQDARLHLHELAENVGGGEARNLGVGYAKGSWIAFLDDDDEWLPQKIELQMQAAQHVSARWPVISSQVLVKSPDFAWISPRRPYLENQPISEFLFCRRYLIDGANYMQTSTLLVRRELMKLVPFRGELRRHQDWDWLLRVSEQSGVSFHMLPEMLSIFHVEGTRSSVGRAEGWELSWRWAREMHALFTPRAYSFFLATECISRAAKEDTSKSVRISLIRELLATGHPSPGALLLAFAFLFLPQKPRRGMRQWQRSARLAFRGSLVAASRRAETTRAVIPGS
jgi:glycosyltransferase involved in cell wall biosynthesis